VTGGSSGTGTTRVAVLGGDTGAGAALVEGLVDAGCAVAALRAGLSSAEEVAAALADARADRGGLDAVVDARVPTGATTPLPLSDMNAAQWAQHAEEPMRNTLHALQGAHRVLMSGGGAVVLVIPTLSMTGAAGLVPWTTAAEGSRTLAKVAARTWGDSGVRVNCLALPADVLAGSPTPLDRPGLPAPSLVPPELRRDAGPVLAALTSDAFRTVTGLTVAVDGGVWMTP